MKPPFLLIHQCMSSTSAFLLWSILSVTLFPTSVQSLYGYDDILLIYHHSQSVVYYSLFPGTTFMHVFFYNGLNVQVAQKHLSKCGSNTCFMSLWLLTVRQHCILNHEKNSKLNRNFVAEMIIIFSLRHSCVLDYSATRQTRESEIAENCNWSRTTQMEMVEVDKGTKASVWEEEPGVPLELPIDSLNWFFCLHLKESLEWRVRGQVIQESKGTALSCTAYAKLQGFNIIILG